MIASLVARFKGWLVAIAAAIVLVFGAYMKGRRAGGESAEVKRQQETNDAQIERVEVENDVASRPDGDAAKRLRDDWSRD